MVLGALTILTVMLTEFQNETSAELGAAISARDTVKAEYAARSAVNLSRLLIASEPTIRARIGFMVNNAQIKVWEYAGPVLGAFNDEAGGEAFSALASVNLAEGRNLGLDGAGFEVEVVDEDSKLNVNRPATGSIYDAQKLGRALITVIGQPQYEPLYEGFDEAGQLNDPMTVCAAILDWVDPNQQSDISACDPLSETASAAAPEDNYYQQLARPYERKNAAFDSLEELRMVRGVDDDFWHTFVDPDPESPDKRNWTVWSGGQVNVNSATPDVIWTLACDSQNGAPDHPICNDPEQAVTFLTTVGMVRGLMPGVPAFASPKGFIAALRGKGPFGLMAEVTGLQPFTKFKAESELLKSVTTESKVFSVYATGYVKSGKRETRVRVHSVVDFRGAPKPGAPTVGRLEELSARVEAFGNQEVADELKKAANDIKGLPEGATEETIGSVFRPSPGGNIIYFRID